MIFLTPSASAQVQLPEFDAAERIVVTASAGNRWQLGAYEVWVLRGNCSLQQGKGYSHSREAVLWIDRAEPSDPQPHKVIAYLEGDVEMASDRRPGVPRLKDRAWLGRFFSSAGVEVRAAATAGKPDALPEIYWRGMERRAPEPAEKASPSPSRSIVLHDPRIQPAQFTTPTPGTTAPTAVPAPTPVPVPAGVPVPAPLGAPAGVVGALPPGIRRVQFYPRGDVPVQAQWSQDPVTKQSVGVIDSGANVIVETNVTVPGFGYIGTIDVAADRVVVWTAGLSQRDLDSGRMHQDERTQFELYLEGNIVFRQGDRTIYADRMYYDVPNNIGIVLNADVLTPVLPNSPAKLRLHADVLRQTAKDRYLAQNAFITSSRLGEPTYRLQSGDVYFEDIQRPLVDAATGLPLVNAQNEPLVEHEKLATASNNVIFLGPVPIFYWPVIATDLNEPTYYIRRARLRQDNVYGTQILTNWNGYQLLGIRDKPAGTDFDISLDYLGKRGFGHGGSFAYDRPDFFGIPGRTAGLLDYWGIQDHGVDNLGQGRSAVPPEASYRFRLFGQHRELLPYDLQLSAELGWISDRNFLEEYYKQEWDELKDKTTGVELKQFLGNSAWSLSADVRLNDFFTQTEWLPRADHFWLGQSVFGALTWYEHSTAAYAQFRQTTIPENVSVGPVVGAAGPFNFLPWEEYDVQGERFTTRQELDWPFQLGAVKVVPYVLGEAAHWGADQAGNPFDRLLGQAGLRASLPMWSVDPTVNDDLFNVHGIAHKVVFDAEFFYAQANRDLQDLPLYDPLDDDSIEAFRRRFMTTTFGVPSMTTVPPGAPPGSILIPPQFDERLYALRSGMQSWVTSPSTEVADDLKLVRLGAHQRWQTKRGPAENRHIIDWITFDTNVTLFPDPSRDNFGQTVGLLDYDFRWHVGDRLTLVSDAIFDFFNQGQKIVSVGGFLTRPPRGSLYAGFRILEGPIHSEVLSLSYSYWMSPKWISSFGTSIDFGQQGNIGENFSITRVGESFLISVGFNVDHARDSVGAILMIEPRFLPKNRLSNIAGAEIPPAGAFGLE